MGKRTKIGKQRKDKFYKLAKETGFRSRASFKLIQLNRKFEFLQKSRILIDLCAAPGGWLQVAQKSMPVSSLIIGVDLVSIKPIPNVITLQEDITTEKCRQSLKRQLKTWKADTVLHDGAPNVGKNWIHDAFAQNQLTLSALKLATEMLVPGGWFITKVFRSKDYNSLLWVFGKLFKKVHVTKPQASRNESAEIFIVCQSYIAPDRIDDRFLDPTFLFKDVEAKNLMKTNLFQLSKRKPKAEGYDEGDASVFFRLKASDFIFGDNFLEKLSQSSEIIFDLEDIYNHRTTTSDVKEYCKDLKVLGKSELRALLNWRKNLRSALKDQDKKENVESLPANIVQDEVMEEELEIEDAVKEAKDLELSKYHELKRKKKKVLKERRKVQEKINLKMIIKDDEPIIEEDRELFNIKVIKSNKDLTTLEDQENLEFSNDVEQENIADEEPLGKFRSSYLSYNRHNEHQSWTDDVDIDEKDDDDDDSSEEEFDLGSYQSDEDSFCELEDSTKNPLVVSLANDNERIKDAVNKWYDKREFVDVSEDDELDLEMLAENVKDKSSSQSSVLVEKKTPPHSDKLNKRHLLKETGGDDSSDQDFEDEEEKCNGVSENMPKKKKKKRIMLDPEGLALGSLMIRSKKTRRDIIDNAYNRYASNDEGLPDWFVKDEMKHNRKQLPVTPELVAEYKAQLKEINARPIKKVVEAKARKKKKALKKMEKARKRAEAITENLDMSEKEKAEQLKTIYKKAMSKKDSSVTYVVAKKGVGKRARRPPGVKGRFKMVDRRMRKDDRKKKTELKLQKKTKRPSQSKKRQR